MSGPLYGQSAPATPRPFRVGVSVVLCLVPLLTAGVFGLVPAVALAVARRRAVDIVGAAVVCLLQLACYVCAGLAPKGADDSPYDRAGVALLIALWLLAPLHFLLMNRRSLWPAPAPYPATAWPAAGPYPQPGYPQPGYPQAPYPAQPHPVQAHLAQPHQAQPLATPQPAPDSAVTHVPYPTGPTAPTYVPGTAPATGDDLQQLAELLRRQAQEGRP